LITVFIRPQFKEIYFVLLKRVSVYLLFDRFYFGATMLSQTSDMGDPFLPAHIKDIRDMLY